MTWQKEIYKWECATKKSMRIDIYRRQQWVAPRSGISKESFGWWHPQANPEWCSWAGQASAKHYLQCMSILHSTLYSYNLLYALRYVDFLLFVFRFPCLLISPLLIGLYAFNRFYSAIKLVNSLLLTVSWQQQVIYLGTNYCMATNISREPGVLPEKCQIYWLSCD